MLRCALTQLNHVFFVCRRALMGRVRMHLTQTHSSTVKYGPEVRFRRCYSTSRPTPLQCTALQPTLLPVLLRQDHVTMICTYFFRPHFNLFPRLFPKNTATRTHHLGHPQLASSASKNQLLEFRIGVLRATPLMLTVLGCAMHNQGERCVDVVLLLLQHGARVDAKDVCGKTALHYICGMSTVVA